VGYMSDLGDSLEYTEIPLLATPSGLNAIALVYTTHTMLILAGSPGASVMFLLVCQSSSCGKGCS